MRIYLDSITKNIIIIKAEECLLNHFGIRSMENNMVILFKRNRLIKFICKSTVGLVKTIEIRVDTKVTINNRIVIEGVWLVEVVGMCEVTGTYRV